MNLTNLFRVKKPKDEQQVRDMLKIMDSNREVFLKKALEIFKYSDSFKDIKPFKRNYYGKIDDNLGSYEIRYNQDKDGILVLHWQQDYDDDSLFDWETVGLIPLKVFVSADYKKLCKEENLKLVNEEQIKKLKQTKLSEINQNKEEFEQYLKLKEKYGKDEEGVK